MGMQGRFALIHTTWLCMRVAANAKQLACWCVLTRCNAPCLFHCVLPTGAMPTVFYSNSAGASAGDLVVSGYAVVAGAMFSDSMAGGAGSLQADGTGNMTLVDVVVRGAQSTEFGGGCMVVRDTAVMTVTNTALSNCISYGYGGAVYTRDESRLVLSNVSITGSIAGVPDGSTSGGGIYAEGNSTIILSGARFTNNSATDSGGGLMLDADATLSVLEPAVFAENTAAKAGGGLRFYSGNFEPTEVDDMLEVMNNTAPLAADISYAAWFIEVVDNGNAEELITSDGKDGVLTMVLNVSGPHGLPSDDQIAYNVYDADDKPLSQATALTGVGDALKNFSIGFKREPGRPEKHLRFTQPSSGLSQ